MRVLLTGASGFIGSHVLNYLSSHKNYELITVGRGENSPSIHKHICADLSSKSFLDDVLKELQKADVILHMAAAISGEEEKMIDVNCKGALKIFHLTKTLNCKRLVNISSIPIIGKPIDLPITENHSTCPQSVYHATKLFSENIFNMLEKDNIKVVNLRIPAPIGEGMHENTILPTFLQLARKNEDIILHGAGNREQNYIDVRDIARAVFLSIEKEASGTFNIASEACISNINLAKLCIRLTNSKSEIKFSATPDSEDGCIWDISIEKAKQILGFIPSYSLEKSIEDMI